MLKKTITYANPFTNEPVVEDHYFHISKADLVEMEVEEHGLEYTGKDNQKYTGMQAKLQRIVDSQDGKAIMQELKDIILRSYGLKQGDRFVKSSAVRADFESSEAFSQLLFDLCTNATAAAEFMNGIVPGNLEQMAGEIAAQAALEERQSGDVAVEQDKPSEPRVLTQAEVLAMDSDELKSGIASGKYKLS